MCWSIALNITGVVKLKAENLQVLIFRKYVYYKKSLLKPPVLIKISPPLNFMTNFSNRHTYCNNTKQVKKCTSEEKHR